MDNVHIACKDDGHIVPRMARWLADGLGWSMSAGLDNTAVVNLYMPYTMILEYGRASTLTSAWFTHKETANRGKVRAWQQAAQHLSQRVLTSPVYYDELAKYGPTVYVTPGIDTDVYTVSKSKRREGIIGLSGIVSGPRKGSEWARPLHDEYKEWLLVAGKGWGVPSEWIANGRMNDFYNRLDVYICTATEEGIPATVLEAMACGCKVVMPSNVGIASLLIDTPGVWHYQRGDYAAMREALDKALLDNTDRKAIAREVQIYSIAAWVDSWRVAIRELEEAQQ